MEINLAFKYFLVSATYVPSLNILEQQITDSNGEIDQFFSLQFGEGYVEFG